MELAGIRKQKGIGLLELMLSFTVIAILLVTAARYYNLTRSSEKVSEAENMVVAVYSAGESWLQSNADFSGISITTFINNGSVTKDFAGETVNPWNGNIIVQQNTQLGAKILLVSLSNVPFAACNNLQEKLQQRFTNILKPGCGLNNFYINFDMSTS